MDYFGLVMLMLFAAGTGAQLIPKRAHRQCTRLSPMPCCPAGYPVPRIRCPMARCPPGFSCHTHVVNRWGVCCRTTLTINQIRNGPNRNTAVARQMPSMMQTCTRQSNLPCCPFGQPVVGINCQVQQCSTGFTCFAHTTGQWAVCCPMSQQQTSRTGVTITYALYTPGTIINIQVLRSSTPLEYVMAKLKARSVVMVAGPMGIGPPSPMMIPGPGFGPGTSPTGPTIPQETQIIEMSPSSCSPSSPTPCCQNATPIPGSNCRFGPCPSGSTCNVHENDAWAVCCPAPRQRPIEPRLPTSCSRMSDIACCAAGQPLPGIQCRVQACPPGYTCNSHINNRWAVCCQDPNTVVTTTTCSVNDANACCPRGVMIPGTQCRTRPCLSNQFCHSNPEGRWAVCCLESDSSPPGLPSPPVPVPVPSCTASSPTPCCSRGEPLNRAQCKTRGCPAGYTCNESTVTGWTACCPTDEPPTPVPATIPNTCSSQSPRPCCTRGNPLQQCQFKNCPSGFECHTHITNAWSVCCAEVVDPYPVAVRHSASKPKSKCRRQNVQPCCTIGRPIQGIDCRAQSCPFGYTCFTNAMGMWAVCCTRLGAS